MIELEIFAATNCPLESDKSLEKLIKPDPCARTVSKNKLPIVGKYKQNENIIMLGGFGSRGFCYGPILGDHVASIIDESPSPLEKNIATSLLPKNFK